MKTAHSDYSLKLRKQLLCIFAAFSAVLSSCSSGTAAGSEPTEVPAAETTVPQEQTAMPGEGETVEEYMNVHGIDSAVSVSSIASFIPEKTDSLIIGEDERELINETAVYPYSAICRMDITMQCGCHGEGTAFMTGGNKMISAAHCLWCVAHASPVYSVTWYFGYQPDGTYSYVYNGPFYYWIGTSFPMLQYTAEDCKQDFAVIQLPENVVQYTGGFGASALTNDEINDRDFHVTGYRDGLLKQAVAHTIVENPYVVRHDGDTLPGNSGCPIFDENYDVVAINVSNDNSWNYGRRITQDLIDFLTQLPDTY